MGLINRQFNYFSGRTIRASELNKNENTLYDVLNGNLEDINIKTNTLTERVLADDINPLVRDAEKYASFVSAGLETVDSSVSQNAKVTISAGIVYTVYNGKMYRKETGAQTYSISHTENGTYYLHIDYQGTFSDAVSADPGAGKQVIAKLVVSGLPSSPVIAVTDLRNMKLYDLSSHYLHGCEIKYTGANTICVEAGIAELSGVLYSNSADSGNIDITSLSNYFEGSVAGTSSWCYVYVSRFGNSKQWEVKLSVNPPQYSDTAFNTQGKKVYRYADTKFYRCVGAVYRLSSGNILTFYQRGNYIQYETFQAVNAGTASGANIPAISNLGNFELEAVAGNAQYAEAKLRPSGSTGNYFKVGYSSPVAHEMHDSAYVVCATNDSQQVEFTQNVSGGTSLCRTAGYWMSIR